MYRLQIRLQVVYGHYEEFVEFLKEINALMKQRGLTPYTVWSPEFGATQDIVLVADYPDLATYQREGEAYLSDAELMTVDPRGWPMVVQGSHISEIFVQEPDVG